MRMFDSFLLGRSLHPLSLLLVVVFLNEQCHGFAFLSPPLTRPFDLVRPCCSRLHLADPVVIIIDRDDGDDGDDNEANDDKNDDPYEGDEDEEEEEDLKKDPYTQVALSEFNSNDSRGSSDLALLNDMTTTVDWGGALGKLRQRFDDISQGKSGNPSQALFRLMSAQSPNQSIGSFVETANPQVVQAMSGTISSLLGGLSNPASGVETIVKATGDKIGSLCFQLQMTGYMFRNVEYVIALKDLMKLRGSATLQDYKDAFDRLDRDKSGYIESSEAADLLDHVYDGKAPAFEIQTFIKFFDQNNDGKISWDEFERGLGAAMTAQKRNKSNTNLLPYEIDDDDEIKLSELEVSGAVQIELKGGKLVEFDAKEYIKNLKEEAQALKDAIYRAKGGTPQSVGMPDFRARPKSGSLIDEFGGIASYIMRRQGDVKALTEGISPEVVETMKMLVNFVLEGGESGKGKHVPKEQIEMEIPGSALQQLALWQLVLGYRLREAEAKGDYLRLLE